MSLRAADVSYLKREVLLENVRKYPESAARLRRATIFLALRRFTITLARQVRRQELKASAVAEGRIANLMEGDLMDRVRWAVNNLLNGSQEKSMGLALEYHERRRKRLTRESMEGNVNKAAIEDDVVRRLAAASHVDVTPPRGGSLLDGSRVSPHRSSDSQDVVEGIAASDGLARTIMDSLDEIKQGMRELTRDMRRLEERQKRFEKGEGDAK